MSRVRVKAVSWPGTQRQRVIWTSIALMWIAVVSSATAQTPPWRDLFDGQTLNGWTQRGGKAVYSVSEGAIVGETVPDTPNSFLCTNVDYGDFELQLEFWVHPELNSGIQIRSQSLPDYKDGQVHGYQVEIDPSDRGWTAGIYDESRRGWLANHADNMPARYAFRQSQWNQVRIVAQGSRLRTWLNGVPAAELIDDMTPRGFIALQVHGVGGRKDPLTVKFKNIRLRDLTGVEVIEADSHSRTLPAAPPGPVFVTGAQPERIVSELEFAEGPAVGPAGDLYFSDIPRDTIYRLNLQTLEKQPHTSQSGNSNGLAFTVNGALIACESGTRAVTRTVGEKRQVLIDKFEERRLNSPNDLTLDGVGGIYFTDPRYGERQSMELEFEGVYYLDAQRKLKLLTRELTRPNGIALSPDNRWLYVADHAGSKLWRYDVVKPGELANGQVIAAVGSDGMTVDAYGRVFITWGREVMVLSAGGETVDRIEFPAATTNCELWDGWLYVTTPNELYRVATTTRSWRQPADK